MAKNPSPSPSTIPFGQLIDALLDADTPLNPRFLYRLSDLLAEETQQLAAVWPRLAEWRRTALLEDVIQLSENDTLLSFEALARLALGDAQPQARVLALEALHEYIQKSDAPRLIELLKTDSAPAVQEAAAHALGMLVYQGELEEIPHRVQLQVEDALLAVYRSQAADEVRREALESLGYSSREGIDELIRQAFARENRYWKASALSAMGRSASAEWQPQVQQMLGSQLPLLRAEAARAAGELELRAAAPLLLEMLDDPDETARTNAIWALSQVGGTGVREALERLREAADDDEIDFLDEAIDNLNFTEEVQMMPTLAFPQDLAAVEAGKDDDEAEDWFEEVDLDSAYDDEDLDDDFADDEQDDEDFDPDPDDLD
ncbi:MAG: HEAT repeat domain-containing protein [Chloroflexota bacterium]